MLLSHWIITDGVLDKLTAHSHHAHVYYSHRTHTLFDRDHAITHELTAYFVSDVLQFMPAD